MGDYEFTEEMREISGFGGSYEQACRKMVVAGVEWMDDHPGAHPVISGYENVVGLSMAENEEAKALRDHMAGALDNAPTGAMMQACCQHVLYVHENSWDEWVEKMEDESV